jgi:hypothetical protein
MLSESKKKNYGITNEEELVGGIRKYIKKNLVDVVDGNRFSNPDKKGNLPTLKQRILDFSLAMNKKTMAKIEDPNFLGDQKVSDIKHQLYLKYLLTQVMESQ